MMEDVVVIGRDLLTPSPSPSTEEIAEQAGQEGPLSTSSDNDQITAAVSVSDNHVDISDNEELETEIELTKV